MTGTGGQHCRNIQAVLKFNFTTSPTDEFGDMVMDFSFSFCCKYTTFILYKDIDVFI